MKQDKSILVIDDEDAICLAFGRFFESRGWTFRAAASAAEGQALFLDRRPAVVFLDVRLPDRSGLELLEDLAAQDARVVIITAYSDLDTVVRAIHGKAYDYLVKPLDLDKALALAGRIWDSIAISGGPTPPETASGLLVGNSQPMQEVYKRIARCASASSPVLIQGETGTGKELVARAIHQFSPRRHGPFVAINCGAIPSNLIESELFGHVRGAFTGAEADRKGRFESAHGGTLLLDEIAELPPPVQVKLLRVLDDGVIERVGSSAHVALDVRILAATNKDLEDEVRRGGFREDLYYRLAVLHIAMPPLRGRKEDILPLAMHFLGCSSSTPASRPALSPAAMEVLMAHGWPGNVRELKNAVEHALALAPNRPILPDDLPASIRAGGDIPNNGGEKPDSESERFRHAVIEYAAGISNSPDGRYQLTLEQAQRAMIVYALRRCGGNQSKAADYLGLHRNSLRGKLRELGIEAQDGP